MKKVFIVFSITFEASKVIFADVLYAEIKPPTPSLTPPKYRTLTTKILVN